MSLGSYFCKGGREAALIPTLWKTRPRAQPASSAQLTDIEPGLDTSTLTLVPSSFLPDNQGPHLKNKLKKCEAAAGGSYKDVCEKQTLALAKLSLIRQDALGPAGWLKPSQPITRQQNQTPPIYSLPKPPECLCAIFIFNPTLYASRD